MATITNQLTATLGNYSFVDYPSIAIAFGYATLQFRSNNSAQDAGNVHIITMGDYSVKVTLDRYAKAEVSLLPFIRTYLQSDGVMDNPLITSISRPSVNNRFRGKFTLDISEANGTATAVSIDIYYIYGTNKLSADTERWLNYNTGDVLGTWVTLDDYTNNDQYGRPTIYNNWISVNKNVNTQPLFGGLLRVTQYVGDKIVNELVNYKAIKDCRTDGVMAVMWLDKYGNINIRKLTLAGETIGVAHSDAYNRPHTTLNVPVGLYYQGDDMWESLTPQRAITLGDDAIPMQLFEWLSGLSSSPVVNVYMGEVTDTTGKWVRCNIGDVTMERDPRKATFSMTLNLILPTDQIQQF